VLKGIDMHYLVLREGGGELLDDRGRTVTVHLAVDGAPETLCATPVSRFEWTDDIRHPDHRVPWCWVCATTATTPQEPPDIGL